MKTVTVTVHIDAPAQRAYQTLCDVERWPEWTPTMQSVQRLDHAQFTVGSKARLVQPQLRPALWEVSTLNEGRDFTWVSIAPGIRMQAGHIVEAAGASCRVTLTFAVTGLLAPIVSLMYGKLIDRYVNTEAQALKEHCEKWTSAKVAPPH